MVFLFLEGVAKQEFGSERKTSSFTRLARLNHLITLSPCHLVTLSLFLRSLKTSAVQNGRGKLL